MLTVVAGDGTKLAVAEHRAAGDGPVALLHHGIASHMGWYHGFAEALAEAGVTTWIADRRGCGRSAGPRGHMRSWRVGVDDVVRVAERAAGDHPGRPLHALGISLGAAFTLAASIERPGLFHSQALLSPGLASSIRVPWHHRVRLAGQSSAFPRTTVDVPIEPGQFTHDEAWQVAIRDDPLRTRRVTARFLAEAFLLQRHVRRRGAAMRLPLLALLAERDAIIDNELVVAALSRSGASAVRVEVFEGATHVLPASVPRAELVARVAGWFRGEVAPVADRVFVTKIPPFGSAGGPCSPPPQWTP
jgi:alpha-beta hydrolase superfamily lysophospholipase